MLTDYSEIIAIDGTKAESNNSKKAYQIIRKLDDI
jgi:hypothetical protein